MNSTDDIQEKLSQFNELRSRKKKQQFISGLVAIAGAMGFVISPLILLSLIGVTFYWFLFWQISKMECPNCEKPFGIGKDRIIGNGVTSCYHCGLCLDGTMLQQQNTHEKEWLE